MTQAPLNKAENESSKKALARISPATADAEVSNNCNPAEEKKLLSAGYQNKMAKSIYLGIKSYLKTKPSIAFYLNNDL